MGRGTTGAHKIKKKEKGKSWKYSKGGRNSKGCGIQMSNFAVIGRKGRKAPKRRREIPISILVLTKQSSILKNMFLSK